MKSQRLTWFLALSLAVLAACKSKDNTNIVVEVWSDLPIPSQLNKIRIDLPDEQASSPQEFTVTSGTIGKTSADFLCDAQGYARPITCTLSTTALCPA